ncbi:unnamed protein product [Amoebophrya sp. A120]|nr:unnamed protein product [Amoebophrya sp. A120]|eukprot:GSA120T00005219001.1
MLASAQGSHPLEGAGLVVGAEEVSEDDPETEGLLAAVPFVVNCGRDGVHGLVTILVTPVFLNDLESDQVERCIKMGVQQVNKWVGPDEHFIVIFSSTDVAILKHAEMSSLTHLVPLGLQSRAYEVLILHPDMAWNLFMSTQMPFLDDATKGKIVEYESLLHLVYDLHPHSAVRRSELLQKFPFYVLRYESVNFNFPEKLGSVFGMPLPRLCALTGQVDRFLFPDCTFRGVPFVLTTLAREILNKGKEPGQPAAPLSARDNLFSASVKDVRALVERLEAGEVHRIREAPLSVLWSALRLFLNSLPMPLLGFTTFDRMVEGPPSGKDSFLLEDTMMSAGEKTKTAPGKVVGPGTGLPGEGAGAARPRSARQWGSNKSPALLEVQNAGSQPATTAQLQAVRNIGDTYQQLSEVSSQMQHTFFYPEDNMEDDVDDDRDKNEREDESGQEGAARDLRNDRSLNYDAAVATGDAASTWSMSVHEAEDFWSQLDYASASNTSHEQFAIHPKFESSHDPSRPSRLRKNHATANIEVRKINKKTTSSPASKSELVKNVAAAAALEPSRNNNKQVVEPLRTPSPWNRTTKRHIDDVPDPHSILPHLSSEWEDDESSSCPEEQLSSIKRCQYHGPDNGSDVGSPRTIPWSGGSRPGGTTNSLFYYPERDQEVDAGLPAAAGVGDTGTTTNDGVGTTVEDRNGWQVNEGARAFVAGPQQDAAALRFLRMRVFPHLPWYVLHTLFFLLKLFQRVIHVEKKEGSSAKKLLALIQDRRGYGSTLDKLAEVFAGLLIRPRAYRTELWKCLVCSEALFKVMVENVDVLLPEWTRLPDHDAAMDLKEEEAVEEEVEEHDFLRLSKSSFSAQEEVVLNKVVDPRPPPVVQATADAASSAETGTKDQGRRGSEETAIDSVHDRAIVGERDAEPAAPERSRATDRFETTGQDGQRANQQVGGSASSVQLYSMDNDEKAAAAEQRGKRKLARLSSQGFSGVEANPASTVAEVEENVPAAAAENEAATADGIVGHDPVVAGVAAAAPSDVAVANAAEGRVPESVVQREDTPAAAAAATQYYNDAATDSVEANTLPASRGSRSFAVDGAGTTDEGREPPAARGSFGIPAEDDSTPATNVHVDEVEHAAVDETQTDRRQKAKPVGVLESRQSRKIEKQIGLSYLNLGNKNDGSDGIYRPRRPS